MYNLSAVHRRVATRWEVRMMPDLYTGPEKMVRKTQTKRSGHKGRSIYYVRTEGGGGLKKLPKFANDRTDRLREMRTKGGEGGQIPDISANVLHGSPQHLELFIVTTLSCDCLSFDLLIVTFSLLVVAAPLLVVVGMLDFMAMILVGVCRVGSHSRAVAINGYFISKMIYSTIFVT